MPDEKKLRTEPLVAKLTLGIFLRFAKCCRLLRKSFRCLSLTVDSVRFKIALNVELFIACFAEIDSLFSAAVYVILSFPCELPNLLAKVILGLYWFFGFKSDRLTIPLLSFSSFWFGDRSSFSYSSSLPLMSCVNVTTVPPLFSF